MAWEDFFLSEHLTEHFDFTLDAEHLILRVFDSASEALNDEWNKYVEGFKQDISKATDEGEIGMAYQEKDWEEDLQRQRMQGVGALTLDWLMSSLKKMLHSAKKYLDKSHPANAKGYKIRGWLREVSKEYRERFGINLAQGPSFSRIEELVLARNVGIHREDEKTLEKYLATVKKPVFVDDEDRFFVTRDALVQIIKDCEEFLKWAVLELKRLRSAAQMKAPG